jgi:trehalose 6-phosphate synthase/phosphatase
MPDQEEENPAFNPPMSYNAITPGVSASGACAYDHYETPQWNANSYFAPKLSDTAIAEAPSETDDPVATAAKGAKTPAELLRRMSLVGHSRSESFDFDPREQYPSLELTGNVISATFCIPYKVGLAADGKWDLQSRRGTSALFDSFSYLSSRKTPWKHTLVGWTGEVQSLQEMPSEPHQSVPAQEAGGARMNSDASSHSITKSASKASAPAPIYPQIKSPKAPSVDGFTVTKKDRQRLEAQLRTDKNGLVLPVWLSDEVEDSESDFQLRDQSRWRRYAEHELYTLFHYRQHAPDDGRAERRWWADYVRMNQLFADRILEVYRAGDIVWIHDYHLMLLPVMLRQRIPSIYVGFFLHIPFPSSEFMRCLPRRKDILEGCLGSTMIAFQSFSYSRHFSSCCERILGFESSVAGVDAYGAHVAIDVFPIGINVEAVRNAAFNDALIEKTISSIRQLYGDKKIIVGRDRLDTVRGVAQKLMAFEVFLARYPEWRDKVVLIQVTSPTSVEEEQEDSQHKIEHKISDLVSKINGEYGSLSHSPVQHYPQYLSPHEYFALLRIADLGLITSVRDGMNTTSLEYVVCQKDHHGPLILSEFSGTAGSLRDAIHINPWNLGGVANAIKEALEMPQEDREKAEQRLYEHVSTHPVSRWCNRFLKRLLTNLTSNNQNDLTPALDRHVLRPQYLKAKRRLYLFDYDGTLTPIVKDPTAAIPSDKVLRTLKSLAQNPKNAVWIISGRDQQFLDEWMGHIPELGLSAEHGCFIRPPRSEVWENLTEQTDMRWQVEVMSIYQLYTDKTPGSFIERKRVALTWHYRRADPDLGKYQAEQCKKHLERTVAKKFDVEVMSGKANLEVRPQFVNKGYIATRLINEYGNEEGSPPDFVFCAGDDFTDEGRTSLSFEGALADCACRYVPRSATVQLTEKRGICRHRRSQF